MVLAAELFDPYRTPPTYRTEPEVVGWNERTGTITLACQLDEAMQVTPGMRERLNRAFPAAWRPERGPL